MAEKELHFLNYQEFNEAIDRICKEKRININTINKSPYGTYIGNYIVKMTPKKPKCVADLKEIVHDLVKKEGKSLQDYDNPCKFYYMDYCLMKVKLHPEQYLYYFSCGGGHPSNCTPYEEYWCNEDINNF